ncbi:MAG: TIGR00730 family Rossman fold protein [Acidimicrobiales bacterium]
MGSISGWWTDDRATLLAVRELRRVGVFCGSSAGSQPAIHALARDLGATLAQQGIGLVFGGGKVGVMGMIADSVLENGGEAIGVLPNGLFSREVPHENLTQLHLVDTMHDRKRLMYELSDGFVILPGGLGTLDELFEAATWNQLKLHAPLKPITLLDHDGFWSSLLAFIDTSVDIGFVKPAARLMFQRSESSCEALDQLRSYEFP